MGRRVGDSFVGMSQMPYSFEEIDNCYFFTSTGVREVDKMVEFELLHSNVYNLCLSDFTPDGIDDTANTNNGDIVKVLVTVIEIIADFLNRHPLATVTFRGNTDSRMNLYGRIIKRYHLQYSNLYYIGGSFVSNDRVITEAYDPNFQGQYERYLIKRK